MNTQDWGIGSDRFTAENAENAEQSMGIERAPFMAVLPSATSALSAVNLSGAIAAPAAGGRIPSLDGLRAVSILLVVLCHVTRTAGSPVPLAAVPWALQGAIGVDVFFAISGMLITTLLLKERERTGTVSLRGFYLRRALRILPAYGAYLLAMAALQGLGWIGLAARDWAAALTYTVNFFSGVSHPLGHLWSLSVEEHFYLLWPPLLMVLGARRAGTAVMACLVGAPLVRWVSFKYAGAYVDIDYATFTRFDAIALGCLVAIAARTSEWRGALKRIDARPVAWFVAGVAALGLSLFVFARSGKYTILVKPSVNAAAICVMMWSAIGSPGTVVGRVFNWSPLAWLGGLSYSLYLWQQVFLDATNSGRWMCRFPQNVVLALAAAMASHYLVERPFLRLKDRLGGAKRMVARPVAEPEVARRAA